MTCMIIFFSICFTIHGVRNSEKACAHDWNCNHEKEGTFEQIQNIKPTHEQNISKSFKDVIYNLPDHKTTIGCFNKFTFEIQEPNAEKPEWQKCYLWGSRWQNISLPPRSHFPYFREFWSEVATVNRLAIVNFESWFDENAGNPYAHGYVQILRSAGIKKDIRSQLNWMKEAELGWRGKRCNIYWEQPYTLWGNMYVEAGDKAWMTCRARGHFGFHYQNSKHYPHSVFYAKRFRKVTDFYLDYFFNR